MKKYQDKEWFNWIRIVLGLLCCKAAYNLFLVPNNVNAGGITGVAQLINHGTGWPVGLLVFAINTPLFVLSFKMMGMKFGIRSFIAMVLLSVVIDWLPFPPATDDLLLATVFGGILSGIGYGVILRGNATTGGTDMLASLIHHVIPTVRVGPATFALDAVVILASVFVLGPETAMYCIISVFLCNFMLDRILEGLSSSYSFFVISDRADQIAEHILQELERGVTGLDGVGMYTMSQKRVLLCVVNRFEVARLRRIVFTEDPAAFLVALKSHDTLGEGFKEAR